MCRKIVSQEGRQTAPGGANDASALLVYEPGKPLVHELKEWLVQMLKQLLIHKLTVLFDKDLEK